MVHLIKYWLRLLQSDKKSLAFKCMNEQLQKIDSHWILSIKKFYIGVVFSMSRLTKALLALKNKLESKYKTL